MKRLAVTLLKKLDIGSAISVRLTRITGKAKVPTHPKHLVSFGQLYYLPKLGLNDSILDLGCHAGEHLFKAAHHISSGIGLDIDAGFLKLARKETKRKGIKNLKFKVHNLEKKLPLKSNQFTKVFFFAVLEHLKNRDQILKEIRRVLKPQGMLFISVPNKNTSWKKLQRSVGLSGFADSDHKLEFSKSDIVKLLKAHRFTKIRVKTTAIDTPLAGLIDLIGGFSLSTYKHLMNWKINKGKKNKANTVGFLITATNA